MSAAEKIAALAQEILALAPEAGLYVEIKIRPAREARRLDTVEAELGVLNPGGPFGAPDKELIA